MKWILLVILFCTSKGYSQIEVVSQSKIPQDLISRLQGVKYAIVPFSKDGFDAYKSTQLNILQMESIGRFFTERLNINTFSFIPDNTSNLLKNLNSFCEQVVVGFDPGRFVSTFGAVGNYRNASLSLRFCDGKTFKINLNPISVSGLTNWPSRLYSALSSISFPQKMSYSKDKQLLLPKYDTVINKTEFDSSIVSKKNYYEGIYKSIGLEISYEIGIVTIKDSTHIFYVSGGYKEDWFQGERKGLLRPTKEQKTFFADWIGSEKILGHDYLIEFEDENRFTLTKGDRKDVYVRIQ